MRNTPMGPRPPRPAVTRPAPTPRKPAMPSPGVPRPGIGRPPARLQPGRPANPALQKLRAKPGTPPPMMAEGGRATKKRTKK